MMCGQRALWTWWSRVLSLDAWHAVTPNRFRFAIWSAPIEVHRANCNRAGLLSQRAGDLSAPAMHGTATERGGVIVSRGQLESAAKAVPGYSAGAVKYERPSQGRSNWRSNLLASERRVCRGAFRASFDHRPVQNMGPHLGTGTSSLFIECSECHRGTHPIDHSVHRQGTGFRDGLDYFEVGYYSGAQGRFTSPDPVWITPRRMLDPQELNLYAYVRNNRLRYVDPDGTILELAASSEEEARKKWALVQSGLTQQDRSHAQLAVGDGKNGFAKGHVGITMDQD